MAQNITIVKAVLNRDISFLSIGNEHLLFRKDSEVKIDLVEMIAYQDGEHFAILDNEFTIINNLLLSRVTHNV